MADKRPRKPFQCECGELDPQSYSKASRTRCRGCLNEHVRCRHKTDPRKRMVATAKHRAKKQGLPFNLKYTDFEIPQRCPVFGMLLETHSGRIRDNSASIDKIIPSLGYVKDNIVIVSYRANRIKNNATLEELQQLAEYYKGFLNGNNK